jgi:AraC family transcriptional regulator
LAKIAIELDRALARRHAMGEPGRISSRILAQGDGWLVSDVLCTSGPQDRRFEESHSGFCIAIVAAGSFQYRSAAGNELMTPGSLLLGNAGQSFECCHEHHTGDRCLSIEYAPEYFERLAADAGVSFGLPDFRLLRLPPLRAMSRLVTRACAGLLGVDVAWEEISLQLAGHAVQLARGCSPSRAGVLPAALRRVTRSVRLIERHPDAELTLARLAQDAGLSSYHFLRTFEQLTGMTPHQYVLRVRLREGAIRLLTDPVKILDIAFDCGFGDVSNFNHAFRAEYGVSPRAYRQQYRRGA